MRLGIGAACVLAALCVSTFAFADDPQPDSVFLRNGTAARGHISEMIAYDHVTIVLPSGETKRIAWAEVEHVLVGSQSPFGPSPPPALAPKKEAPSGDYVHVHFTASGGGETALLYRSPAGTMEWETVCQAPCDADVPLHDRYRIGGNGARTRDVFLRGTPGGSTTLHADGRSTAGVVFGGVLMATGALLSIAALGGDDNQSSGDSGTRFLVLTAAGGATLAAGIVLYVMSAKTDIEQHPTAAKPEVAVRRPTWRTLTAIEQSTPQAAFPVLYEGRF